LVTPPAVALTVHVVDFITYVWFERVNDRDAAVLEPVVGVPNDPDLV